MRAKFSATTVSRTRSVEGGLEFTLADAAGELRIMRVTNEVAHVLAKVLSELARTPPGSSRLSDEDAQNLCGRNREIR